VICYGPYDWVNGSQLSAELYILLFSTTSRRALGPNLVSYAFDTMNSIPRGKRAGAWSCISIPAQFFFATECLIKHKEYFTFIFLFILT